MRFSLLERSREKDREFGVKVCVFVNAFIGRPDGRVAEGLTVSLFSRFKITLLSHSRNYNVAEH